MSSARRFSASYWFSMALLVLAAGLVVGFFWIGGFFSQSRSSGPIANKAAEALDKQETIIRRLTLKGKDAQGRTYVIRASHSRKDEAQPDIMHFFAVSGSIDQSDGKPLFFRARRAEMREKSNTVILHDDVIINKRGKWRLEGPRVAFNTKTHALRSDSPVVVHMDNAIIRARGMEARNEGKFIRFKGPVHTRFRKKSATTAEPAATPNPASKQAGQPPLTP